MRNRQKCQQEVHAFLQEHLSPTDWKFSLPHGWGKESYFAEGSGNKFFVKVGVEVERYLAMAETGLTPPVVIHGQLESGVTVIVQSFVEGRNPSRADYRERLNDVARIVRKMQGSPRVRKALSAATTDSYREAGLGALDRLHQKWGQHKAQVPSAAGFVEDSLGRLARQVEQFTGEGLVASHGDICNANWLFASDGNIYLIDFDLMKRDDPAFDLGALLWWYYPPALRKPFLDAAGHRYDEAFKLRMQVRMAMHCLDILLPREDSFDQFKVEAFGGSLQDFKAVLAGQENPQGYDD
jgi:thiamine kinase-like enzyme